MGSESSDCCGSNNGKVKPDPYNTTDPLGRKRESSSSYVTNGERTRINEAKEQQLECISTGDISKCASLDGCIKIVIKYNKWLEDNDLCNKRTLRQITSDTIDYNQYNSDISKLIKLNEFISDLNHIKHFHHYHYKEIREYIINTTTKKNQKQCLNDNCFSMKYYFLCNKESHETNELLFRLTNLHIFLYHSMYISALRIENVHPRDSYLVINYSEQTIRQYNINIYNTSKNTAQDAFIKIIHLISFYYGGKYIEDTDTLDTVSALGLGKWIEQTMNKATLNQIWSKLDRDGSDTIDAEEVDDILLLTVILSVAMQHKNSGGDGKTPQIDKKELKVKMAPIAKWMKGDKMLKQPVITKDEFRDTFSTWLKEYHTTNGGIIADEKMQKRMLRKYKIINDEKNGNIVADKVPLNKYKSERLVVNCEYLMEHTVNREQNEEELIGN